MKQAIPLERTITDEIMAWMKKAGFWAVKIHGAAYQTAGLPDILALDKHGRLVGLEVKRPAIGKVTALQEKTLRDINLGGGYAVVVRSLADAQAAMGASAEKACAFHIDPHGVTNRDAREKKGGKKHE